ncbi:hypothetical protein [Streptomyces sp. AJS327]|nr:hypothetical protein [Streptomyces sp. AJS327]
MMTILNAVSREVAKEIGCSAEAKLPAKTPHTTETWPAGKG